MSKVYDGIMGLVVGDALGVPVEFCKRDTYKITDMTGHGTYNQPAGTWSDDSSMTLATMESIARLKCLDLNDIMDNFARWMNDGLFTPHGNAFDVGGTTRCAIERYLQGVPIGECCGRNERDNGNGALMRILPAAFLPDNDWYRIATLTHGHQISNVACNIYVGIARNLICGMSKETAIEDGIIKADAHYLAYSSDDDPFSRLPNLPYYGRDMIRSTGYVVDTLEAALWCLYKTDNYRDCVLTAVNLGDDTDTVAAVAGGLAGLLYGCGGKNGIPDAWIREIACHDWITHLCFKFARAQE